MFIVLPELKRFRRFRRTRNFFKSGNMKKYLLPVYLGVILLNTASEAQNVAINNDASLPAAGAILDVKSSNKGILIPRIALTGTDDVSTLPDRQESLFIYNTATIAGAKAVAPGFYFWNGSSWARLTTNSTSLLSGWLLGGNLGTSSATNFLGTTDDVPLAFKVNNQGSGIISGDNFRNTFFGYQSGMNNGSTDVTGIGYQALFNLTTGQHNTAVGSSALRANSFGNGNTAIGSLSLFANSDGSENTADGYLALFNNTSGMYNTGIGSMALLGSSGGNNNTAVGAWSFGSAAGNYNSVFGARADMASNLTNATAIGARSQVDCSNCLVLGSVNGLNNATSNVNVGIGTSSPAYALTIASALADKLSLTGSGAAYYGFAVQANTLQIHSSSLSTDVAFGTGNSASFAENFRIKGNGHVYLGMTNSNATLNFGQALAKKIILFHGSTAGDAAIGVFANELRLQSDYSNAAITFGYDLNGTSFVENMRLQGNVLHVRGAVFANSSWYSSDSRYKTNLQLITHGLSQITSLNGYHYNWKDKEKDPEIQTGLLAQEVQKIFPELVRKDSNGYLSVNYVGLIPYLIESVKELQLQIMQQKEQTIKLKKDNEELKNIRSELNEIKQKLQKLSPGN
jgi:hypothetical protein